MSFRLRPNQEGFLLTVMRSQEDPAAERLLPVALLTLSGGLQDAYTYLCRGRVFANAQTGNIVLLGHSLCAGS